MVIKPSDKRRAKPLNFELRDGLVPTCIVKNCSSWYAVEYKDASHVLLAKSDSPGVEGEVVTDQFGVSVSGVLLQGRDASYFYAKVDQYIVTRATALLTLMSRHFNGLYESAYWDSPLDGTAMFRDRYPDRELNRELTIEQASSLGYPKITSAHHVHFTVREAAATVGHAHRHRLKTAMRVPNGVTSTMVTGLILWLDSLEDDLYELVISSGLFKCQTQKEFMVLGKQISVEAKSLQNLVKADLRQVFEIDVLTNRIDGDVDWAQEKVNRTQPRVTHFGYNSIFDSASAIFNQAALIGRKPVSFTWDKYWASRWQWSAAGSVHSQYVADEAYVVKTDRNLKNKFIMISNMPDFSIEHFVLRQPEIHAWASTKYEWGKLRAIYGTDTTSYILSNFAFYNCENVLPNRFPVGKDANDKNVSSRVAGVLSGRLPYCLDFEDFNSQHSIEAMQAVIDAYGQVFSSSLSADQKTALDWTSQSVGRQIIHDNVGLKEQYNANGTLLSGWRLTTFVNSVLNAIYTDKVLAGVLDVGASLHNGDDVLIGATSMEVTRRSLLMGYRYNVRIQPSKCAFAAIAEFLRVDHKRGSKGQYLTRAIATLVHSRIESKPSTDARDLVNSMENRFSDCHHRGMPIATIALLRELYYRHQSKVCRMSVDDMYTIKTAHRVAGGISEAVDAGTDRYVLAGVTEKGDVVVPYLPGVNRYASEVAKLLDMEDKVEVMVKRIYKATYEAVVPKSRSMRIVPNSNEQWCINVKAIYKAFKGTITTASFGKAAMVGFAIDVLATSEMDLTLSRALSRSPDPERLLKFLV